MARDARNTQLGAFLRARRGEAPAPPGRRRVPGLRRGEVAARAFISEEYYTRIEQGRAVPSPELVERIGAVLGFDGDQAAYALGLLGQPAPAAPSNGPDSALTAVLDHLGDLPAVVVGPFTAILAWNAAAAALLIDFGRVPVEERLYVRLLFTDEQLQNRFEDLDAMRRTVIGVVRTSAPSGIPTGEWIADLARISPEFAALWERNDAVRPHLRIRVRLCGDDGAVTAYDQVVLQSADDSAHRLVLFVPAG
ncbi:helix-turn-helix transcriptional regulator [Tsukamurella sp. NPDC003166]|uniref:helix-turn-helix domain-containing protein n=1 Tax=Tsukamurella sp. NPDC003166 TaxID=3154444 RepID=UPI00339F1468